MKLTISKTSLLTALSGVIGIISPRTTLPILTNILFVAKAGKLQLTASNLDCAVSRTVEAEIREDGAFTLPGRRVLSIVRELEHGDISIEVEKGTAKIRSGASRFSINGLPAEEFPTTERVKGGTPLALGAAELRAAIERTLFAASTDETRYVLNGVLFDFNPDGISIVGTDGRRLSLATIKTPSIVTTPGFILATKGAELLIGVLDGVTGDVVLQFNDAGGEFILPNASLTVKFVEGTYPNYRAVIPNLATKDAVVNTADFIASLARVALMGSADRNGCVDVDLSPGKITLRCATDSIGEALETVAAEYTGPALTVSFNPDYFLAPLRHIKTEKVALGFINATSPMIIREPFVHVIMPRQNVPTAPPAAKLVNAAA